MESTFPNIDILFRTYICLPVTSAACERSFSVLKWITNYHCSTVGQERLCSLGTIAIQSDVLKLLDFDNVFTEFAHSRSRKRIIWTVLLNASNCWSVTGMHCQCHWFENDTLYYIIINNSYTCIIIYTKYTIILGEKDKLALLSKPAIITVVAECPRQSIWPGVWTRYHLTVL